MARFCLFLASIIVCFSPWAAIQQGMVKTIGRPNAPGKPIAGVIIRAKGSFNSTETDNQGKFKMSLVGLKDGDEITFMSVSKKGYTVSDRALLRQTFSSKVPIVITMVQNEQLTADKSRIERNAQRKADENYKKKTAELNKQLSEAKITEEKYRQELQQLQRNYENYQALIGDMAERYARTDYDVADSTERQILMYIEEGEFDQAEELILTFFDPYTVLERNQKAKEEIAERIKFAEAVIAKAEAEKALLLQDMEYAERVLVLGKKLSNQFRDEGNIEKAVEYMEKVITLSESVYGKDSEEVKTLREELLNLK